MSNAIGRLYSADINLTVRPCRVCLLSSFLHVLVYRVFGRESFQKDLVWRPAVHVSALVSALPAVIGLVVSRVWLFSAMLSPGQTGLSLRQIASAPWVTRILLIWLLWRTWTFAPRRRARMPVRRVEKGRGFQGDAAAWASHWSGLERLSEVITVGGRGEASRLNQPTQSRLSSFNYPRLTANHDRQAAIAPGHFQVLFPSLFLFQVHEQTATGAKRESRNHFYSTSWANMDVRPPASGHGCPYAGFTRPGVPRGRGRLGVPLVWAGKTIRSHYRWRQGRSIPPVKASRIRLQIFSGPGPGARGACGLPCPDRAGIRCRGRIRTGPRSGGRLPGSIR